jgi:hypothetical protein
MALTLQQDQQGLLPLYQYGQAPTKAVNLGVGGPYGTGGAYPQGLLLGCLSGQTAQSEVVTLDVTGTPTGTKITFTYTGDKVYQGVTANLVSAQASTAQVATALEAIFGAGNVAVTGTAGLQYVITFQNRLANTRINGNLVVTATFTAGTGPAIAATRTTRGSCGAAQYEAYHASTNDDVDAILMYDTLLDPTGARVTPLGTATGQSFQPTAYVGGYFDPATLVGIDADAYLAGKLFKKCGGAVVRLI